MSRSVPGRSINSAGHYDQRRLILHRSDKKTARHFFDAKESHVFKIKVSRLWGFINFTGGQLLWPAGNKVKLALAIISYVYNVHNLRLVCLLFSASPSSWKYN